VHLYAALTRSGGVEIVEECGDAGRAPDEPAQRLVGGVAVAGAEREVAVRIDEDARVVDAVEREGERQLDLTRVVVAKRREQRAVFGRRCVQRETGKLQLVPSGLGCGGREGESAKVEIERITPCDDAVGVVDDGDVAGVAIGGACGGGAFQPERGASALRAPVKKRFFLRTVLVGAAAGDGGVLGGQDRAEECREEVRLADAFSIALRGVADVEDHLLAQGREGSLDLLRLRRVLRVEHPADHALVHPKPASQFRVVDSLLPHRQKESQLRSQPQRHRNHAVLSFWQGWRRDVLAPRKPDRQVRPQSVHGLLECLALILAVRGYARQVDELNQGSTVRISAEVRGIGKGVHVLGSSELAWINLQVAAHLREQSGTDLLCSILHCGELRTEIEPPMTPLPLIRNKLDDDLLSPSELPQAAFELGTIH
jgi:hypothetical protein